MQALAKRWNASVTNRCGIGNDSVTSPNPVFARMADPFVQCDWFDSSRIDLDLIRPAAEFRRLGARIEILEKIKNFTLICLDLA